MITLITGTPGTGKTAWIVNELLNIKESRSFYIHGIPELKIPHHQIFCKSPQCSICTQNKHPDDALYVDEWNKWKEPGSLIIVDECQNVWRPRASTSKPPEYVTALETHRHDGLDFWIISQAPNIIDKSVRLMVSRHIHLVVNWRSRMQYEWPEVKEDVSRRTDAVVREYKLPKRAFKFYKSAEVHTKIKKNKPLSFYFAIGALVTAFIAGVYIYQRLSNRFQNTHELEQAREGIHPENHMTTGLYPDFKPVIPGKPESAPAYAELLKVKSAPILSACIKSANRCQCYTQQATPYPTSKEMCEEFVKGNYFNPFVNPAPEALSINEREKKGMITNRSTPEGSF